MGELKRKLPIGIQSFAKLRENNHVYVDKTEYIYRLVHTDMPYFLSRPRRFGKSLLLSTLKAYWEGKRELFLGLKIEELERDNPDAWQAYPVFYFDFNRDSYADPAALGGILEAHVAAWEKLYGIRENLLQASSVSLSVRFQQVLQSACEQTGRRCVILVDEYDKPLLETMASRELVEQNKNLFRGFFSTLKSYDAYIQFIFITGITKFSKVSIFSDLNQLKDISMSADYAKLCGITEKEMKQYFAEEIRQLAYAQDLSIEECLLKLKQTYDGYHFHQEGEGVYNPYSLLNALEDREFDAYWFETGTPTFLIERLKKIHFNIGKFTDGTLYASKRMLKEYGDDNPDPIPLLYQTGYLTISDYDRKKGACILSFPNEEVKYGFLESLLPAYVEDAGAGSGKDILTLAHYVEAGDLDSIRKVFTSLFASIPYTTNDVPFEHDFQTVFYITLTLLGQFAECELHTSMGRIDCMLRTKQFLYIFEFKRDSSADEALKQIEDRHYADPYMADPRKLYRIGVNFSSVTRQMEGWKVT